MQSKQSLQRIRQVGWSLRNLCVISHDTACSVRRRCQKYFWHAFSAMPSPLSWRAVRHAFGSRRGRLAVGENRYRAAGIAAAAPPIAYVAGQSHLWRNGYVKYIAGNAPVILTAPHGGTLSPLSIPVRCARGV